MRAVPCFVALLLVLAVSPPAHATIDLRPTQITVQAERGETVVRTIQARISDDISDLSGQPMELLFEKHSRAIPVQLIKVMSSGIPTSTSPRTLTFTLEISLVDVPAGEYIGDLPFTYKGGEIKLPLKVSVRHRWPWPLFVLCLGVGAGVGLSAYRLRGRPRDQVLVRVGLVRAYLQRDRTMTIGILPEYERDGADKAVPNPFKTRIEAALVDVEMSLTSERWDEARTKMDQTDALLRKWIQGRLGWIEQLAYLARLQNRMYCKPDSSRYVQSMRGAIDDACSNAPALESPKDLRDSAQQLTDRVEEYERAEAKIFALEKLSTSLPVIEQPAWIARTAELRLRLNSMRPEEKAAALLLIDLDHAMLELSAKVQQVVAATPDERSIEVVRTATAGDTPEPAGEAVPEAHLEWLPFAPGDAKSRLRWFEIATYAAALILLGGTGFNEVYIKKLTFGAELWSDYFTLLVWGFGAEATRDSVTSTLRGWGTPVDSKASDAKPYSA
jgi:hypothetical protein